MLIDKVIAFAANQNPSFREQLGGSTVIKAHNVADHVFRTMDSWDLQRDFPNVAPPFEQIWMEWSQWADWRPVAPAPPGFPARYPMGVFLLSFDLQELRGIADPKWKGFAKETLPDAARWWTIAHFSRSADPRSLEWAPCFSWCVSPDGALLPIQGGLLTASHPLHSQELSEADMEIAEAASMFLPLPLMALSLMNCKNVRVEKGPPIDPKLARARQRRGKPPLFRWRTLVIDPTRSVSASSGTRTRQGVTKALHAVRGHFKDFKSSGLFGRHKGLYWWSQYARGSAIQGNVLKDYEVRT